MLTEGLREKIENARVAVLGDFCLDVYWTADMRKSVLSRETPHFPLPVVEERMSPGGAGNVACNVAALRPKHVYALGLIGGDWRGQALLRALGGKGVDASSLTTCESRVTNAYIKPLRRGISDVVYEDPRLDFENFSLPGKMEETALLLGLERLAGRIDVLLVCDQMAFGCVTPAVREAVCALGESGARVIVDSRDRIGLYKSVTVKPNDVEAARATGETDMEKAALALEKRMGRTAVVTLGEAGCLVAQNGAVTRVPAFAVEKPVDICGAGDTFMAAFGCALATDMSAKDAARFANAASSVTVKKIGVTGVATPEEIEARLR